MTQNEFLKSVMYTTWVCGSRKQKQKGEPCMAKEIPEKILKQVCAEVLELDEFDDQVFAERVERIGLTFRTAASWFSTFTTALRSQRNGNPPLKKTSGQMSLRIGSANGYGTTWPRARDGFHPSPRGSSAAAAEAPAGGRYKAPQPARLPTGAAAEAVLPTAASGESGSQSSWRLPLA